MKHKKKISLLLVAAFAILCFSSCSESNNGSGIGAGRTDTTNEPDNTNTSELITSPATSSKQDIPSVNPTDGSIRLSFVAAGDNIIHESVFVDARNRAVAAASTGAYSGNYYFDEMYAGVRDVISKADIAYINQEGPVAGDSLGVYGYPTFNAPEEIGDALIRTGFDIINLANNHMLDMDTRSRTGYAHTIEYWKTKNVMTIGAYENEEDYNTIRIYEKDGIKIAMLSYTYGTNGNSLSAASPGLVIPYIDDETISRHIASAKTQADLVFVSMHWGTDTAGASFNNTPTQEQRRLAQMIADCGADVIIGMHPHVIQPVEWLTGSSGNKTLVTYSIGNFLSTMLNSYNMLGGILAFDIVKSTDGNITIEKPEFLPMMCHYAADPAVKDSQGYATRSSVQLYMLENYTNELAMQHGTQLYGKFDLNTLYKYVTDTIDPMFLPEYIKNK